MCKPKNTNSARFEASGVAADYACERKRRSILQHVPQALNPARNKASSFVESEFQIVKRLTKNKNKSINKNVKRKDKQTNKEMSKGMKNKLTIQNKNGHSPRRQALRIE